MRKLIVLALVATALASATVTLAVLDPRPALATCSNPNC